MSSAGFIPIGQAARLLEIGEERVRQLIKTGYIPRGPRGEVALVGAVQGYIRWLLDENRPGRRRSASLDSLNEKRAIEIEQRIAAKAATLIPREDAENTLKIILRTIITEIDAIDLPTSDAAAKRAFAREVAAMKTRMDARLERALAAYREGVPPEMIDLPKQPK